MQAIDHRRTPNPSCQLREVSEETIKEPVTNPWLLGSAPGTVAVRVPPRILTWLSLGHFVIYFVALGHIVRK